jgi:hypothetical protein
VDLNRIIQDLKAERDTLAAAIECLEQLAAGRARKRGRPPKWLSERGSQQYVSLRAEPHDRNIPDEVKHEDYARDDNTCRLAEPQNSTGHRKRKRAHQERLRA